MEITPEQQLLIEQEGNLFALDTGFSGDAESFKVGIKAVLSEPKRWGLIQHSFYQASRSKLIAENTMLANTLRGLYEDCNLPEEVNNIIEEALEELDKP